MATTTVSDRIAATLTDPSPAASAVREILGEARGEAARLAGLKAKLRERAMHPTTPAAEVKTARAKIADADFEAERLIVAVEALEVALSRAEAREAEAGRRERYDAACAALKGAEAALAKRWDALAGEMTALLTTAAEAVEAATTANQALPQGAAPLAIPDVIDGRRAATEERIIGERTVELWCYEGTTRTIDERQLEPAVSGRRRIKYATASNGVERIEYAVLVPFREITFVPARTVERGVPIYAAASLPALAGAPPYWQAQDYGADPRRALATARENERRRTGDADAESARVRHEPLASEAPRIRLAG
ncbi:MAG: hypothetical protein ACFE0R_13900 [Salinarimonas sp.]